MNIFKSWRIWSSLKHNCSIKSFTQQAHHHSQLPFITPCFCPLKISSSSVNHHGQSAQVKKHSFGQVTRFPNQLNLNYWKTMVASTTYKQYSKKKKTWRTYNHTKRRTKPVKSQDELVKRNMFDCVLVQNIPQNSANTCKTQATLIQGLCFGQCCKNQQYFEKGNISFS